MPTGSNSQPSERNFRLLWFAQTSSLIGVQFGVVAIPLVAVVTLNATPFQVGLLTSLSSVAWLAFGLFVGVAVDRLPRKSLIIVSHLGRSALLIGVAGFCRARYAIHGGAVRHRLPRRHTQHAVRDCLPSVLADNICTFSAWGCATASLRSRMDYRER